MVLVKRVLNEIEIDPLTGRIIVPALWRNEIEHLLSSNYGLARSILLSQKKRLSESKILEYDKVIKEQLHSGVIEPVDNRQSIGTSYIAHSAVFRENANSTKCRVVFLSNLSSGRDSLSHNQISMPGANLNHKLQIALLLLRFDANLVTFDLRKAFLQLLIKREDTDKLHFLWFKNPAAGDFSIVTYRICRVPFGMRYSPFLLMISLYYILINCAKNDDKNMKDIKMALYDLAYVDNLAYTANDAKNLIDAINVASSTFSKFKFELQQFSSNVAEVREHAKKFCNEPYENNVKLLGMMWNVDNDKIANESLHLNINANTKRTILSSLQRNFDPFGLNLPLLNRAKLFVHGLQCDKTLEWDTRLSTDKLKVWHNICKQVNKGSSLELPRSLGSRNSNYNMLIFCDASKEYISCVIHLQEIGVNESNIVLARNSVTTKNLSCKSIPILELAALEFGVHTAVDLYQSLNNAVRPIIISNLNVYSDSLVALSWLKSRAVEFGKIDRKNVFINNKINKIIESCKVKSMNFSHINGKNNPADSASRCMSRAVVDKTCFVKLINPPCNDAEHSFTVPHHKANYKCFKSIVCNVETVPIMDVNKFSFKKSVRIMHYVLKFISNLKNKCKKVVVSEEIVYSRSYNLVLSYAQLNSYPQVFKDLQNKEFKHPLISQLNLFLSDDGLIRVKSKMRKLKSNYNEKCPILLDKNCPIAKSIIIETHNILRHGGIYKTLSEVRKHFWITNAFVTTRKLLKNCIICSRMNNRAVKLSQNAYKDYRVNPEAIPFRNIAIDHCGPFTVKNTCNENVKMYVLCITCLWSRSVNLLVCKNIDKHSFVRALQLHIFDYGTPSLIISDNGSPIVSGMQQMISYLNDDITKEFLLERNIKCVSFQPYPAGASKLGGLVESMVKQIKRIVTSTIRNNILLEDDFTFLISEAKMLINKRPIAYKNILCKDDFNEDLLNPLTPEIIIKGYDVACVNIIPQLNCDDDWYQGDLLLDNEQKLIKTRYNKLNKVKSNLEKLYHEEFIANLKTQATDRKNRYSPVSHQRLSIGDLVSIKSDLIKPFNYPLAIVMDVEYNDIGEVVSAKLRKSNGEIIRRHGDHIIFLSESNHCNVKSKSEQVQKPITRTLPGRDAARKCKIKNKLLLND